MTNLASDNRARKKLSIAKIETLKNRMCPAIREKFFFSFQKKELINFIIHFLQFIFNLNLRISKDYQTLKRRTF